MGIGGELVIDSTHGIGTRARILLSEGLGLPLAAKCGMPSVSRRFVKAYVIAFKNEVAIGRTILGHAADCESIGRRRASDDN